MATTSAWTTRQVSQTTPKLVATFHTSDLNPQAKKTETNKYHKDCSITTAADCQGWPSCSVAQCPQACHQTPTCAVDFSIPVTTTYEQITQYTKNCQSISGCTTCHCGTNCKSTVACGKLLASTTCDLGTATAALLAVAPDGVAKDGQIAPSGTATCQYDFNFDGFDVDSDGETLLSWLTDLATKTNTAITHTLPTDTASAMRNMTAATGVLHSWYASLTSQLADLDSVAAAKSDLLDSYSPLLGPLFPDGKFPTVFRTNLRALLQMPVISHPDPDQTNYCVELRLTSAQFQEFQKHGTPETQNAFLENMLDSVLRDSASTISTGLQSRSAIPAQLEVLQLDQAQTQMAAMHSLTFELHKNLVAADLAKNPILFSCLYTVTCRIKTWSPMLVWYATQTASPVTIDSEMCGILNNDLGGLLPWRCVLAAQKETQLRAHCGTTFSPAAVVSSGDVFVSASNLACDCFNNQTRPAMSEDMDTAMCFSNTCQTPDDRKVFGLTDQMCTSRCSAMYGWLHSTDPAQQPNAATDVDHARYAALCGTASYGTPNSINLLTLLGGCAVSAAASGVTYMWTRKWLWTVLVLGLVVGIFVFLSFDFAGRSACVGDAFPKTSECRAQITKWRLPQNMCSTRKLCECALNSNCSGEAATCLGGVCTPVSTAPSPSSRSVRLALVLLLACAAVILPLGWWKLPLSRWLRVAGLVVWLVVPIVFAVLFGSTFENNMARFE